MGFVAGIAIVLSGLAIISFEYLRPAPPPTFSTLAVWVNKEGAVAMVQWRDGAPTKETLYTPYPDLTLHSTYTVEGRPVDRDYARAIITKRSGY